MHSNKKQLIPEKTESTAFSGINFYIKKEGKVWKCQKDDYRLYKVKLVNIVMNWENDNYMNIRE